MNTLKYAEYFVVKGGIDANAVVPDAEAPEIILLQCFDVPLRNFIAVLELERIPDQVLKKHPHQRRAGLECWQITANYARTFFGDHGFKFRHGLPYDLVAIHGFQLDLLSSHA